MVDLRRRVVAFLLLAVKPGRDIGHVFKIQVQRSYVMCKSVGIVFQNWNSYLPKEFFHVLMYERK